LEAVVIVGIAILLWGTCLLFARRARTTGDRLMSDTALPGVALVGLVFVILPSVELAVAAIEDAVDGNPAAVVLALLAVVPLALSTLLFRRARGHGKPSTLALRSAVIGGAVPGAALLLWVVVAAASTGL
jgi:hypothetical protein